MTHLPLPFGLEWSPCFRTRHVPVQALLPQVLSLCLPLSCGLCCSSSQLSRELQVHAMGLLVASAPLELPLHLKEKEAPTPKPGSKHLS